MCHRDCFIDTPGIVHQVRIHDADEDERKR
jgi:hypothetical protein